eukprot:scaffold129585_cov31-Tisochrysis_lutea.AAC.1
MASNLPLGRAYRGAVFMDNSWIPATAKWSLRFAILTQAFLNPWAAFLWEQEWMDRSMMRCGDRSHASASTVEGL